jgi:hypothetical protein
LPAEIAKRDMDNRSTLANMKKRRPNSLWLSMLGCSALSYLAGAAVVFYELPTSEFLERAFLGARAWKERKQVSDGESSDVVMRGGVAADKAFDGYTLYACAEGVPLGTQAMLIDMDGNQVHRWMVPFSQVWPKAHHVRGRVDDSRICFFGCRVEPNGELLVVFLGGEQTGGGLAKLDRHSKVLWKYAAPVHHDVDVGDDGTIYALREDVAEEMPKSLERLATPALVDSLVLLSPAGIPLREPISLVEALRNSPYSALLSALESSPGSRPGSSNARPFERGNRPRELLHANAVRVLGLERASSYSGFKPGQVLVSLRDIHALAVLDVELGSVVWATSGPWRAQHDPHFLDDGRILLFDNRGLANRSRVLEYDPRTQAFPWSYSGDSALRFFTNQGGMCQRLPNGNTLIVSSSEGKIIEVTRDQQLAWSATIHGVVTSARRYARDEIKFLKGPHATSQSSGDMQ